MQEAVIPFAYYLSGQPAMAFPEAPTVSYANVHPSLRGHSEGEAERVI